MEKQAAGIRGHFIRSIQIAILVGVISYGLRYATLFYGDIADWTLILGPITSFFAFFFTAGVAFWVTFFILKFNKYVAALTFAGLMAGIRVLSHYDNFLTTPIALVIVELVIFGIHLFAYLLIAGRIPEQK